MPFTVAFATENGNYDAEVYRHLLMRLLGTEVEQWPHHFRFNSWKRVLGLLPLFLHEASRHGVDRALLAIDNDGGARRGPEHEANHGIAAQTADPDGCRVCRMLGRIPEDWRGNGNRSCVVVPVQTLETWLLVANGHVFEEPTPEQRYHRWALKKDFFGKPIPPEDERTRMALEVLDGPRVLDLLRGLRSFNYFEGQIVGWP